MKIKLKSTLLAVTSLLALAGCGGGDGGISGTGAIATGTMQLSITDAPSCGYDHVYLSVDRVRIHKSATAVDGDGGWSEVVLNPARRIDLLTLTNGVLDTLGQTALPAGKYTQMRLVLAPNAGSSPFANAVTPTGGAEVELTTPSAQQSGLKFDVNMDVAPGTVADFVIDFDACKSIVNSGNSGKYILKPKVTVIPVVSPAGMRVEGYVDLSIALATNVSVQANGLPFKATVPDANGKFVLYPVPVGTYDLVVSAAGHVTAVMTGVPVVSSAVTTINSTSTRIVTPTATLRTINGTVNPATATVRALQMLTGGPTIEAAWGLVDDSVTPATFSFSLPIEAPVKTAYAVNPTSLTFMADAPVAGKYTLEANSGGTLKTQAVDANATLPDVAFTFP
jgi:hypothetical protein